MIDGKTWLYARVWSDGTIHSAFPDARRFEPVEYVGGELVIEVAGRRLRFTAREHNDPRASMITNVLRPIVVYQRVGERDLELAELPKALARYDRIAAWLQQPDVAVACDQLHEEGALPEPSVAAIWRHRHLNQKIHERIAKGRAA